MQVQKLTLLSFGILAFLNACTPRTSRMVETHLGGGQGLAKNLADGKATYQETCPDNVSLNVPESEKNVASFADLANDSGSIYELTNVSAFISFTPSAGSDKKVSALTAQIKGPFQVTGNKVKQFDKAVLITCHNSKSSEDKKVAITKEALLISLLNEFNSKTDKVISNVVITAVATNGQTGGQVEVTPQAKAETLKQFDARIKPASTGEQASSVKLSLDTDQHLHVRTQRTWVVEGVTHLLKYEAIYQKRRTP